MKKYIVLAILASLGLSQFFSGFEVFSESSSTSSNTEKYVKKTEQTVKTYITRLEKSGFSSSDIIATLEKVKTLYMKKKSDNNYTGIKKITVDAIISALEKAINERKGQNTNDEDLYDIFNTIPTTSTTTTTTITNTYYSGTTNTNCTTEYAPVCGVKTSSSSCTPDGRCYVSDGMMSTYSNKCELLKAKATYLYSGACKTTIDPPSLPICSTGTLTNSSCICKDGKSPRALESGTRIQTYTCDPIITPGVCTKEYAPVCAMPKSSCNGTYCTDVMPTPKTYDNKCMMEVAGATYLYSGSCKTTPPTPICATGNFASSNCVCSNGNPPTIVEGGTKLQMYTCDPIVTTTCGTEYAPVCGQYTPVCPIGMACLMAYPMPTTYPNKCELLKARASYLYSGVCTSDM